MREKIGTLLLKAWHLLAISSFCLWQSSCWLSLDSRENLATHAEEISSSYASSKKRAGFRLNPSWPDQKRNGHVGQNEDDEVDSEQISLLRLDTSVRQTEEG